MRLKPSFSQPLFRQLKLTAMDEETFGTPSTEFICCLYRDAIYRVSSKNRFAASYRDAINRVSTSNLRLMPGKVIPSHPAVEDDHLHCSIAQITSLFEP